MLQTLLQKMLKLTSSMKTRRHPISNTKKKKRQGKDFLFIIKNWNAKGESQEISRIIGKFGLVVQSETGPRLTEFCQENMVVIKNTHLQQHKAGLYPCTSAGGKYENQIDYILSA